MLWLGQSPYKISHASLSAPMRQPCVNDKGTDPAAEASSREVAALVPAIEVVGEKD